MDIQLDPWQEQFLDTEGDKILCCGRQVGKSVIAAMDAGTYALKNAKKEVLMIAPTERQAYELFDKTLSFISFKSHKSIKMGKSRPTKKRIQLKNGTIINCLPTGISGVGIRGRTVHRLYVDEASRVPEEVWTAVTPMLLTTGGDTILLSTPFGRQGYFYRIWNNPDNSFTKFELTSIEALTQRPISKSWTQIQRDKAIEYLQREKQEMSSLEYGQEYEGRFIDELRQFFPTELITKSMSLKDDSHYPIFTRERESLWQSRNNFLGVDIARMGDDETVLFTLERINRDKLRQLDMSIYTKVPLTETARNIIRADKKYNYKKIYIDDGGLGAGVLDILLEDEQTKRKVIPINNASRPLDKQGKRKRKLMKEELYTNLLRLMEQGKVELVKDADTLHSLQSIQYEYVDKGIRIFGRYTHITEALIRAAWSMNDKSLNIWVGSK